MQREALESKMLVIGNLISQLNQDYEIFDRVNIEKTQMLISRIKQVVQFDPDLIKIQLSPFGRYCFGSLLNQIGSEGKYYAKWCKLFPVASLSALASS